MRKRILLSLLFISILTVFLLVPVSLVLYHDVYDDRVKEDLLNELYYCEELYDSGVDISQIVKNNRRLTLIADDGKVLFDSRVDSETMENHLDREEIQLAKSNGSGLSERKSNTLALKYIYAALALNGGEYLRIGTEAKTTLAFIPLILLPSVFIILVIFIIVFFLSYSISKKLVEPINSINLDNVESSETYDELAPLLIRIARDKKRVDEEIRNAEEKKREFELISSGLDEGLAIVNNEGTILSYNNSFLKLLGLSKLPSSSVFSCFGEGEAKSALISALDGKKVQIVFPLASRMIEEVSYPAVNRGIIILLRDVTETIERENIRKEFTANVSHELKTPLTTISGFAELLMTGDIPTEKVLDFSHEIYKETSRLINLVEDIINLSSLDEGRGETKEKIDLKDVALDVIEELTFKANKENVKIKDSLEDIAIKGSFKLCHEIIFNLLDNSIRYSKKENGWALLEIFRHDDEAVIRVSDNGIGIEKDSLNRVFERFYRVDKSRSKESGGTGLGLSIVKNATNRMNGNIKIDSEKGEGTTIEIHFPLYK